MNIFFLSESPYDSARMMVDKHVVKMIVESAQLLSTAHRLLDGTEETIVVSDKNGKPRKKKVWILNDTRESFYNVTHANHPSAVWTRTSVENYNWLVDHLHGLLLEYTHRYKKTHATQRLFYDIQSPPHKLKEWDWTTPPSCVAEDCHVGSYIDNYREYYRKHKAHIHKWTNREPPEWIMKTRTTS